MNCSISWARAAWALSTPLARRRRKWQISSDGGTEPLWARDGSELFYRSGSKVMSVSIDTDPELRPGTPGLLFDGAYANGTRVANYDVAANGEGFLMIQQSETSGGELEVVLNWLDELKRLVPTNN